MIFSKDDQRCQAVNGTVSKLLIPEGPKEHSASFLCTGPGPFGSLIPTQILSMGCDRSVVAGSVCSGNRFVTHVRRCHLAPCNVRDFLSWVFPKMSNHSTSTSHSRLAFCVEFWNDLGRRSSPAAFQRSKQRKKGLEPWPLGVSQPAHSHQRPLFLGVDGALDLCPCIKHLSGRAADADSSSPGLSICVSVCQL